MTFFMNNLEEYSTFPNTLLRYHTDLHLATEYRALKIKRRIEIWE